MQIGILAKRAGVTVQTIRFYEREHLLREPERTRSGYRVYGGNDVASVRFIKDCQAMGFSLKETRQLIHPHRLIAVDPSRVHARSGELGKIVMVTRERLDSIEASLRRLKAMRRRLSEMLRQIEHAGTPCCPASRHAVPQARTD